MQALSTTMCSKSSSGASFLGFRFKGLGFSYRWGCARNHLQVPCHFGSGGWSYVMYAQQYSYMMYTYMMHAYMMHAYTKYAYMMYAYMMYAEPHGDGFESDVGSRASAIGV